MKAEHKGIAIGGAIGLLVGGVGESGFALALILAIFGGVIGRIWQRVKK